MSLTSSPPKAAVASNISPWMRQARSQLGSRLAVASSAKIRRPRPPDGRGGGARCRARRKASTSAETSPGFAAGQEIDADAFFESVVRPQPLDDNDAKLHPIERAGMDDDAALRIADA